jgi:hypothetical protein
LKITLLFTGIRMIRLIVEIEGNKTAKVVGGYGGGEYI